MEKEGKEGQKDWRGKEGKEGSVPKPNLSKSTQVSITPSVFNYVSTMAYNL